jgi:hypothetical protein
LAVCCATFLCIVASSIQQPLGTRTSAALAIFARRIEPGSFPMQSLLSSTSSSLLIGPSTAAIHAPPVGRAVSSLVSRNSSRRHPRAATVARQAAVREDAPAAAAEPPSDDSRPAARRAATRPRLFKGGSSTGGEGGSSSSSSSSGAPARQQQQSTPAAVDLAEAFASAFESLVLAPKSPKVRGMRGVPLPVLPGWQQTGDGSTRASTSWGRRRSADAMCMHSHMGQQLRVGGRATARHQGGGGAIGC